MFGKILALPGGRDRRDLSLGAASSGAEGRGVGRHHPEVHMRDTSYAPYHGVCI